MTRTVAIQNQIRSTTSGTEYVDTLNLSQAETVVNEAIITDEVTGSGTLIMDLNYLRSSVRDIKGSSGEVNWNDTIVDAGGSITLSGARGSLDNVHTFIGATDDLDASPDYDTQGGPAPVNISQGDPLNVAIEKLDVAVVAAAGSGGGGVTSNALVGTEGITVISGSPTDTIQGFRSEFVASSGSLQTQIDSIDVDEVEPAIIGSDGITVTSGSNTTVSGFRDEFVSASGSLQSEIDAIDSSVTLQEAYDNGDGIITTTDSKPVVISGSSKVFIGAHTVGTPQGYLHITSSGTSDKGLVVELENFAEPDADWNAITINANDNVGAFWNYIDWDFNSITNSQGPAIAARRPDGASTDLAFFVTSAENKVNLVSMIGASQSVGVNTDTPSERLHVVGSGIFDGDLDVQNGTLTAPTGTFSQSLTISGAPVSTGTGVSSHGLLTGLGADDHTQYVLADGTRPTQEPGHLFSDGAGTLTWSGAATVTSTTPPSSENHIGRIWFDPSASGGDASQVAITTKTGDYTAVPTDNVILGDATSGDIVITLFSTTADVGRVLNIKKIDASANTVTVSGNGSNIDDGDTAVIADQYGSLTVVSTASAWWII